MGTALRILAGLVAMSLAASGPAPDASPVPTQVPRTGTGDPAFSAAVARASQLTRLRSLLISVDGRLVEERYFRGAAATRPTNVKSVSKSIMALLIGIALDRKALGSVRDPVSRYLPASSGSTGRAGAITVEDLLTMRSGLETTSNRNYGRWVQSPNWVRHVLQRPMVGEPGGRMTYSTGNTHVLSAILTRATGMSTLDFARRYLGTPLGITIRSWTRDPQGIFFGGNEMSFTSRELLHVGALLLNEGRHGDRQVVSPQWIRESTIPRVRSERQRDRHYGYGWWLAETGAHRIVYAWGYGGQFVFVLPDFRSVVVVTSVAEPGDERREQRDAIYDILDEEIVPVLARR